MIKTLFLFAGCLVAFTAFSQSKYEKINAELSSWDAVRGTWLANSYEALEKGFAIPDRNFPEDLTPTEVFQLAPESTRNKVLEIVRQAPKTPETRASVPANAPSVSADGRIRRPLEDTPTSPPRMVSSTGNFNSIFTNANCQLVQGRSYGDPHIRSFDGSTFSFQTVGEYILARGSDGNFEVQGRQKAESDKVSMNSAVAMNVAGDRVGIYMQDQLSHSDLPLRVNGQSVNLQNETYFLPSGGTIQQSGKKYIITWPTGERVQADMLQSSGRRFINLSIYVYNCYGDYYGVLGNANGSRTDDFNVNGRNLNNALVFDPFDSRIYNDRNAQLEREQLRFISNDYGSQFLVNNQNTLFEYPFGMQPWNFVDPSFPRVHLTMNDISQSNRDRARQECIRQGIAREELSACIMDFSHANIAPTPNTSVPDRVTGRSFTPVQQPVTNRNRADAGGGSGYRSPWQNGETPSTRQPSGNENGNGVRKPLDEGKPNNDLRSTPESRGTNMESAPVRPQQQGNEGVRPGTRSSVLYDKKPLEETSVPSKPQVESTRNTNATPETSTRKTTFEGTATQTERTSVPPVKGTSSMSTTPSQTTGERQGIGAPKTQTNAVPSTRRP